MPVLGIDLGASTTVLATVGRGGIVVVRNDLAERLTPTLVSYTSKERLIGDSALTSLKANIKTTARNFKYILGAPSPAVDGWRSIIENETQYCLAPLAPGNNGLMGFQVSDTKVVSATEVLAAYVKKLRIMGQNFLQQDVRDVVVAVPSWFPEASRKAVVDACEIANIHCLAVMNHNTATALDYGIFRKATFEDNRNYIVLFVDMGYSSCTCTIAKFTTKGFEILFSAEDPRLGGRSLDLLLFEQLAKIFQAQTKLSVTQNAKASMKLLEAVEKSKKILSANRETHVNLECFIDDYDFNHTITRDNFVSIAGEFRTNFRSFLEFCVKGAGVPLSDIGAVEICGGCTRIPFVQEDIKATCGKLELSRTLSADECVARGAAIQAAMLHPQHRVAEFKIYDKLSHQVNLCILNGKQEGEVCVGDQKMAIDPREAAQEFVLFKKGALMPCPVVCTFTSSLIRAGLELAVKTPQESQFPFVLHYRLDFSKEQLHQVQSNPQSIELRVSFAFTPCGLLHLTASLAEEKEVLHKFMESVPRMDENGAPVEGEFDEVEKSTVKKERRHTNVIVVKTQQSPGFLTSEAVAVLHKKEEEESTRDSEAELRRQLANDILSDCFEHRKRLNSAWEIFVSHEDRQRIVDLTLHLEEWVEQHPDSKPSVLEEKRKELEIIVKPIKSRCDEHTECLREIEKMKERHNIIRDQAAPKTAGEKVVEQVEDFNRIMQEDEDRVMKTLSELSDTLADDFAARCKDLRRSVRKTLQEWENSLHLIQQTIRDGAAGKTHSEGSSVTKEGDNEKSGVSSEEDIKME